MELKDMLNVIVSIMVGGVVAAAILPSAISDIANANTTGWDSATTSLWGLVGIAIVLAVVMVFFRMVRS